MNDCVPTTLTELNDHFGGSTSYDEYVKSTNYIDDKGVVMKLNEYDNLLNNNFEATPFDHFKFQDAGSMQSIKDSGNMISVHMKHGNLFHADNIRSIKYYSNKVVVQLRIGSYKFTDIANNKTFRSWSISGIK